MSPIFKQFILWGMVGLLAEVIFTGIMDIVKNKSFQLKSSTSIWMLPIYGLIVFAYPPLHDIVGGYEWYVRGAVYMVAFFVVEYASGWILLKVTGDYVWRYSNRFNLNGFIDLPHAPVWFFAGLGVEKLYPVIVKISGVLNI